MLFIEFHLFYAMLWIPLIISLMFFKMDEEEFKKLKKGVRFYYKLFPFICVIMIYLYPFMNAEVFTESPEDFVKRVGFLLIGATYVNVRGLVQRYNVNASKSLFALIAGVYLTLILVWNICVHNGVFAFIVSMVLALVAILPMNIVAECIAVFACVQTKERQEAEARRQKERKEWKEKEEAILAEQAKRKQAQLELDRKRRQEQDERDRQTTLRLHEMEAQGKLPKYSGKQWTPQNEKWSWDDEPEKKSLFEILTEGDFHTDRASGGDCCDNCDYYRGGICRNPASNAYNEFITSSGSRGCVYHS